MTASDRAHGALLGLAIGDALGMPTQYTPRSLVAPRYGLLAGFEPGPADNPISANMPAGRVTDDTDQAVILGEMLDRAPARRFCSARDPSPSGTSRRRREPRGGTEQNASRLRSCAVPKARSARECVRVHTAFSGDHHQPVQNLTLGARGSAGQTAEPTPSGSRGGAKFLCGRPPPARVLRSP